MEEVREAESFGSVVDRLEAILEAVSAEDVSLDESLRLFEEAAKLGLAACDRSEEAVSEQEQEEALAQAESDGGQTPEGATASDAAADEAIADAAAATTEAAADADADAAYVEAASAKAAADAAAEDMA